MQTDGVSAFVDCILENPTAGGMVKISRVNDASVFAQYMVEAGMRAGSNYDLRVSSLRRESSVFFSDREELAVSFA